MSAVNGALRATVIVVAFQQEQALPACLRGLRDQVVGRDRFEVVVVDNGGNGGAREATAGLWDRWLVTDHNLGCSGGRNFGAADARTDVLFFVDDDGVPDRAFIATGLAALDADADAVAVRGRVVPKDHWVWTTLLDGVANLGPEPVPNVSYELEGASCVRRTAFEAVGGFDERLAGGEGRDFVMRAKALNPRAHCRYEPTMVLAHDYVRGFGHFLYKARRAAIARERTAKGDAMPTFNPPRGTFTEPNWKPPLPLRVARRVLNRASQRIGQLPYDVRAPK